MRIALQFYCREIRISVKDADTLPTILACNHPNSFLDALVIGSHYSRPLYYLARGDVFVKPWISFLLRRLHMVPIHRLTEGRRQLKSNEASFRECLSILQQNGVVLIFSEGFCKHDWTIQPLKKGTARLAFMAWTQEGLKNMVVRPFGLTYSSFTNVPMSVWIKEGELIRNISVPQKNEADFYQVFNGLLHGQLQNALADKDEMKDQSFPAEKKWLFAIPAFIGWVTHKWLYNLLKALAIKKTRDTVFFHSVLFFLLLVAYPIFLISIVTILTLITGRFYFLLLLFALPFFAWSYKKYKG